MSLLRVCCCLQLLQVDAEVLLLSLLPLLTSGNEEAVVEAARTAGNLARASPAARAALLLCNEQHLHTAASADADQPAAPGGQALQREQDAGSVPGFENSQLPVSAGPYVLASLVLLLEHGSWEVVHSVSGALVNLTAAAEAGAALSRVGLAPALADVLQRVCDSWPACSQPCQQHDQEQGSMVDPEGASDCRQAAQLLLQCAANMVTASAAAVSEAIMGVQGPRCAEVSCSSNDLATFSRVVHELLDVAAASDENCDEASEGSTGAEMAGIVHSSAQQIVQQAQHVVGQLDVLWGV